MTPQQITIVQATWEQIHPDADAVATLFYSRLLARDPSLRRLFPDDLQAQRRKLATAINLAVRSLKDLESLEPMLQELGRRHVGYGVHDRHYSTVGAALLDTLAAGLGDGFTPAVQDAWTATYQVLSETMKSGAARAREIAQAR